MYDIKGLARIDSFLESDIRFKKVKDILNWERCDVENFKYYDLPKDKLNFNKVDVPDLYGCDNMDTWYKTEFKVPDLDDLYFNLELETDSLVIINNREKYYSLNPFHKEFPLSEFRGKDITINICIWNGYIFPGYHPKESDRVMVTVANRIKKYPLKFNIPVLTQKNGAFYELYYDVLTLRSLIKTLDENSLEYQKIVSTLHKELHSINYDIKHDIFDEEKAIKVRKATIRLLKAKNGSIAPQIYSIGSAHLDHAWLWPENETIRKAARTLSEMTYLMNSDPSFIFMHSQPLQLKLVKEYYPKVFEELYKCYERGQFEPNGVGLIEPDCMLSTAEGHIRNLLEGRKITSELFEDYSGDTFYVPDSFGYMITLPQILNKSGVKYIATSKLGWNDTNRHPYDIFAWKGLDGTSIYAHMIQGAYEGTLDPKENLDMWNLVQNKDVQDSLFRPIGEGDGGGGTRLDDLELMKRQNNLQGIPKNKWSTISKAMSNILSDKNIPEFNNELYLELHRGTYTTQAKIKYYHRKLDKALHNCEYLLAYNYAHNLIDKSTMEKYFYEIKECWLVFLTNQFHDILPGSSVEIVNKWAKKRYLKALDTIIKIIKKLSKDGELRLNLTGFDQNDCKAYSTTKDVRKTYENGKAKKYEMSWGSVEISSNGQVSSFIVNDREYCRCGFNKLKYGNDYPNNWDAWDIEADDQKSLKDIYGKYNKGNFIYDLGNSKIIQEIRIYKDEPRIDFINRVDWKETHKLLQVEFSHNINSNETIFDMPLGYIKRSNKKNNSYERAKYEVPGHNYICQRDEKNIIALLTDSKYGYSNSDNKLGISLLRSPKAPDRNADMEDHMFTYSLIIENNNIQNIMAKAEIINNDYLLVNKEYTTLARAQDENIILETVKIAEDKDSIIFRFRETIGIHTKTSISFDNVFNDCKLKECNLMESLEKIPNYIFNPFEIKTYKMYINK